MAAPKQTTSEGERMIAEELAAARELPDPSPADVPFAEGGEDEAPKPRRGRPPGSKNTGAGRRSRSTKLDAIVAAADTAIQRGALLASYAALQAPIAPERKMVWMRDAEIVGAPKGREALTGSLRIACERNARVEKFCTRLIEASAYTGIGAALVFGLVLPIALNHGMLSGIPPQLAAMLTDTDDVPDNAGFSRSPDSYGETMPFAGAPHDAGEVKE